MSGVGISTHVLDTTRGEPAAGVAVTLFRRQGGELQHVGSATTGDDGRIASLVPDGVQPGWYQLVFDLDPYYGSQQHFYARVTLDLNVAERRHHHLPLLISPFSASVYRGS